IVNTTGGAVSIATHQTLAPGVHHLAGVYDGAHIQLYIDGALAASRSACDHPLQQTGIPVTIGHIAGGSARFQGTIAEVYLSPVAQSAAWVAATYRAGAPT
ncbi:MAG: LamG domain-containing protein, partial [Gemmatimonadota bacterium]|nr:LamG domain-containing protein [Gemmatimonadota bacterium]